MNIIILLVLSSVLVAIAFLIAFLWATSSGQYDDVHTPAMRILFEDRVKAEAESLSVTNYPSEPDHVN